MGKDELNEQISHLERLEAKTVHGAPTREPKAQMLDASALTDQHPDRYFRYVTTRDPNKPQQRKAEGFTRVDAKEAEEAGVSAELGTLVLMQQPRKLHDARVKRQEEVNKARLTQHNREAEAMAESIARELRDKHGVDVSPERLLIREE